MTHPSTTAFSNLGEQMRESLVEVNESCPKHDVKLISAFGKPPVCMACGLEERKSKEEEMVLKATNEHFKRTTYRWLTKRSIFLDQTLKEASFDNYQTNDEETVSNKDQALKIAREYYKGGNFNTIFTGKAGTGKSHLAMSMLKVVNEYSDPYRKCLFVSVDELMRRIKDSFGNKESHYTEQRMVEWLTEADLLVLDDLGAEIGSIQTGSSASDFTVRMLYAIINGRMNKPTILTTNLNSKQMANVYDSKLISRMYRGAEGHIIKFENTKDKRIKIDF